MGRSLFTISIIVLSLLVASASTAEEVIQNGGFESGDLSPWEEVGDSTAWTVTGSYAFDGAYSAFVRGPYRLAQSFVPRPGANIEVFSIAVMTGMRGWITVEVAYDDEMEPTRAQVYVPAALEWQVFDLLEYIDPDRDVYRVVLSGHGNGDSPDDMRTWYDAVSMQNNTPQDDPSCEADEILRATTEKVKVKFNTRKPRTILRLHLTAEELPEGIHEGPVDIQVFLSQDGFTTAFDAEAELVDVPHEKKHILILMDEASAEKEKAKK